MSKEHPITQRIMNAAYKRWNMGSLQGVSYDEFVDALSMLQRNAVVLGNLNYQVENGGFMQWVVNHYSSQIPALLASLQNIGTKSAKDVRKMVMEVRRFLDNDGDWEDDTDGGQVAEELNRLDKAFYKINAKLLDDAEKHFAKRVGDGEN